MKATLLNILSLVVIQFLITLFCFTFLTVNLEQSKEEQNAKIEMLEKQIQEYQERNERLIKTNLDIFINHRWE